MRPDLKRGRNANDRTARLRNDLQDRAGSEVLFLQFLDGSAQNDQIGMHPRRFARDEIGCRAAIENVLDGHGMRLVEGRDEAQTFQALLTLAVVALGRGVDDRELIEGATMCIG